MPELPEVEIVCRGIKDYLENNWIKSCFLNRSSLRFPLPDKFCSILTGSKINLISRRGKYILIYLDIGFTWLIHLGMSGQILVNPDSSSIHDHIKITLNNCCMIYRDPRRFGYMDIISTDKIHENKYIKKLGIEPITDKFNSYYLWKKINKRISPIKNLLMIQSIVAGLGNIYVCEALFVASINPIISGKNLSIKSLTILCSSIKFVLKEAIRLKGSSIKNHIQIDGKVGGFQHKLQVYGRRNADCFKCKNKISHIIQAGRATFFCSYCQKY